MAARQFPHLPPGREPGAQTLRGSGAAMWWFVGVVGLAMLLAGAFVAAGGRGPEFDRSEELWGGLFFGAFGALALWVGYANVRGARRQRPRRDLENVSVRIDPEQPRRGQEVQVTVAGRPGLEVGLECIERFDHAARTRGAATGSRVRQVLEVPAHAEWRPAAGATESFRIPFQAPYSYEGTVVTYYWRVSVREVRALRADARNDHPLWVLP